MFPTNNIVTELLFIQSIFTKCIHHDIKILCVVCLCMSFFVDPRSLLLLNKLITVAAKNMHKLRADVDCSIKTQISTTLAKSEARAGLARYYYTYDNSYCRF